MFGHSDDQQAMMGSPTVQNPSMLDNVSQADFQATDDSSQSQPTAVDPTPPTSIGFAPGTPAVTPSTPGDDAVVPQTTDTSTTEPEQPEPATEHPLTTDNPFAQDPIADNPAPVTPITSDEPADEESDVATEAEGAPTEETPAVSPSGPVDPPPIIEGDEPPTDAAQDDTGDAPQPSFNLTPATSSETDEDTLPAIDFEKLASMKKQALSHLEPLADKLEGTPEETFRTTMMMIQANDNHELLEKALKSAKDIKDDKDRAQAMLDIINEINYFSQQQ